MPTERQYQVNDNSTATFQFASGATLTLNGAGPNSSGAFAVTVQSPGPAPITTFPDEIYLATDSVLAPTNSATLTSTLKLTGPICGPGNLIMGGNGILQIGSANNTYGSPGGGMTTVLSGTLQLAAANALPVTTSLVIGGGTSSGIVDLNGQSQIIGNLSNGASGPNEVISTSGTAGILAVNYQGSTPLVYTGALGDSTNNNFAFATTGSGTVVLAGNNTYTQGTAIGPGATLQLGNNGTFGSFAGNVSNNGSLVFNLQAGTAVNAVISGTGSVTMAQGGVSLTGPNTYSGATYVQNGTLVASASATSTNPLPATTTVVLGDAAGDSGVLQLGDNAGPVNQTVAALTAVGMGAGNGVIGGNANNSTLTVNLASNSTFSGNLGDPTFASANGNNLALWKSGTARLTLSGTSTYSGPTIVNSGILEAGSASAFSGNSAFTVNAPGILRISGNIVSVGSIAGAGTVENANAVAGLLVTGLDNTNTIFSGLIRNGTGAGTLGLWKTGSGVLTLAGSNTYTGPTTINAGTLQLTGQSRQASPFAVSSGAALAVSTAANTAVLASSLTLGNAPGDTPALNFNVQSPWSASVPMLAVSGAITTNGTTSINLASAYLPSAGTYPLMDYTGSILGSGTAGFTLGSLPSRDSRPHCKTTRSTMCSC